MVERETTDGTRIARLLSSEIHGHEREVLGRLSVVDARSDVEPSVSGTFAYGVDLDCDGGVERLADVFVHPDRSHVEFRIAPATAATAAESRGLRVRPKAVDPPRTLVFVENGAEVKRVLSVIRAVATERIDQSG